VSAILKNVRIGGIEEPNTFVRQRVMAETLTAEITTVASASVQTIITTADCISTLEAAT
jgi:hypothetical protein